MKVLIVDDNRSLASRMADKLRPLYTVDSVASGEEGVEKASTNEYAVIVLDLGLPGINGLKTCRRIRTQGNHVPILILTGDASSKMTVAMLDGGADDYLTKPFNGEELRARVGALARRRPLRTSTRIIGVGDLVIDTGRHEVTRQGARIDLRRKEFDILEYLAMNKGRIVTRQMILDNAWKADAKSWRTTVDVHIKHLRDKVDRPFDEPLIHTAHGLGYKVEDPEVLTKERRTRHD